MARLSRGILIAVEGADGSGKSTLVKNIAHAFEKDSIPVVVTKEFGGTPLGQTLRKLLHNRTVAITDKAEYLLIAADRAQHSSDVIMPNLNKNNCVISDRMGDSSLVYQGYGRGLDKNMIQTINQWAMNDRTPDITIYVRIDVNTALKRIKKRSLELTAFEKENREFFKHVVHGYDTLYKGRKDVIILDGSQTTKQLVDDAYNKVIAWLTTQKILT